MVSIKSKIVILFVFLFLGGFVFAQTITTPIDPIPSDEPCTGGSEVSVSECNSYGVPCIGKCFRAFRGGWTGGTEWFGACYHCDNSSDIEILPGVKECVPGMSKYEPDGNCDTKENKCCDNGKWSGFGKACLSGENFCLLNQCWDGSACQNKDITSRSCSGNIGNASSGTQTRTATCNSGSGWSYGAWAGTCNCNSGYTWGGSSCNRASLPSVTVYNCQAVPGSGGDNSHIWIGAVPSSAPSAAMYAYIAITADFWDSNGSYTHYGTEALYFPAGSTSMQSKEFDMGFPDGCSEYEGCTVSNCVARLSSSGWQ